MTSHSTPPVSGPDSPAERAPSPRRSPIDLASIREVSWPVLVAVVLAASAGNAVLWYLLSIEWQPLFAVEQAVREATGGFVQLTLLLNVALLLVVVGGFVGLLGGLRLRDLTLNRADLRVGVLVTLGAWLALQVVGALALVAQGQPVAVNEYWTAGNALAVLGLLAAQLFGNALYEEVLYRGFLLNQVRHKLAGRFSGLTPRRALLAAVLLSQFVFALVHVPGRLVTYPPAAIPGSLVVVFVLGVLLAVLYYRTGNLFVAVGLHAFINAPTMLVGDPAIGNLTAVVLVVVVAAVWPWAERRVSSRRRVVPTAA